MPMSLLTQHKIDRWLAENETPPSNDPTLIRRTFPRFPTEDNYYLQLPTSQPDEFIYARGYNISPQGLGVFCKVKLDSGAHVSVFDESGSDEPWMTGTIVHSTLTVGGFKIGLRFDA